MHLNELNMNFKLQIMRKIILVFTLSIITIVSISQNVISQDTLTYNQTQQKNLRKIFKKGQNFKTYVLKDGSILSLGDTLEVGIPASGSTSSFEVGDVMNTTISMNNYLTISMGKYGKNKLFGIQFLSEGARGIKVIIDDIQITHFTVQRVTHAFDYFTVHELDKKENIYTITTIDQSMIKGEIINPNGVLTRNAALEKLKEAKELLDLELITQAEYNTLKEKLSPIIMKK